MNAYTCHISFKHLFDNAELERYDDSPKQTYTISDPDHSVRVILVPFVSHFYCH